MKELEMNEMEKKANRIVNRKENEVDDELPPFLFAGFFILTIFFFLFGALSKRIIFYILAIIFFLLMITTTHIIEIIIFIKYRKDKEYQLAKEIMEKYNKKVFEIEEKEAIERRNIQYKATLEREKEKTERMIKMKEYLKGSDS